MNIITSLNIADYIIMGVITLSLLISLARGFIREALSLASWIVAALAAFRFSGVVSDLLSSVISSQGTRSVIAFVSLFIIVLILGGIVNYFVSSLISGSLLRGFDRILGSFFGLARGLLVVGLFVLLVGQTAIVKADWWQGSQLIPQFKPVTHFIQELFPEQMAKLGHSIQPKKSEK